MGPCIFQPISVDRSGGYYLLLRFAVADGLIFHEDYISIPEDLLVNQVPHSIAKLIIVVSKEYAWTGHWIQFLSLVLCYMHVNETPKHLQMLVRHVFTGPCSLWFVSIQG